MNFDSSILENPEIFQQNRLPAHSDHICYASQGELLARTSSYRISLDGLWYFSYARNFQEAVRDFEKSDYDCHDWEQIRVPAHIQMEGYDAPHYTNCAYPWDGKEAVRPGEIPTRFNPTASYVKYFRLPEQWHGQQICIAFGGVESGFALWLNGQYVGYSENSFDPAEFDLTPYLVEGENKLAVRVWKWTSGSWCEDQDFFRFSGIFRSVYLYAVPKVHLWDLRVEADVQREGCSQPQREDGRCFGVPCIVENTNDSYRGILRVRVRTQGTGKMDWKLTERRPATSLESNIDMIGGKQVAEGSVPLEEEAAFSEVIWRVHPWSAEDPHLYVLTLTLYDEAGHAVETVAQNVGFRHFEMKNGLMLLNGKRIVFKGVNRHEFSSVTGRVPNRAEVIRDIETMKRYNINAIRTSHYPDDALLYELCDIYGLYLIAENNLESHGTFDAVGRGLEPEDYMVPGNRPEWLAMMLDRVNSCYQRDKNHPAILIWSCGNESRGGSVIYEMSKRFRELDPGRLVHYEGILHDRTYNDTSDMESQMYPSATSIRVFLAQHPDKPFICCEYSHAMGNSCGGMHKYTDLADEEPRYQGGFLWDYVDQSIYQKDRYGREYLAYGGDFDDRPSDYNFSGNGIVYGGERLPSPKMQEVKFNYQGIAVSFTGEFPAEGCTRIGLMPDCVTVWNKNLFINTDQFAAYAILQKNGTEVLRVPMAIAVAPGQKKEFALPQELAEYMRMDRTVEYAVTVSFQLREDCIWAKAGHEVAFGQAVFSQSIEVKEDLDAYLWHQQLGSWQVAPGLQLVGGHSNIGVQGENFRVLFSTTGQGMVSYVYGGVEMIKTVPQPNFWRAPTDNDRGNQMPQRYAQYKLASLYASLRRPEGHTDPAPRVTVGHVDGQAYVQAAYRYYLPTTPEASCDLAYRVYADGSVRTTLHYNPVAELGDMPEFGVLFKLDADYDRLQWYGLGPEETYSDRRRGSRLGIYSNRVADNLAQYLRPQECGNHCGVRWAKVTDRKGRGMAFLGEELSVNVLPYTPHEIENAAHAYELPEVHYTVVRVALAQMGVAGDDSWGARTHPEYLLDVSKPMNFTFSFKGI